MAVSKDFRSYVEELFSGLGTVRFKPMFGVVAVYVDELMCSLIADDVLFLRVDEKTEARFRDAGATPFLYSTKDGREIEMSYWRAPDDALEGPDEAAPWLRLSLDVALRKQAAKGMKRRR